MRTGSRKYHIAALLVACMGGGMLYAGETTPPDVSPDRRLQFTFYSQASEAAEQDHAFATLQFEIDFVDAALGYKNRRPDAGSPTRPVATGPTDCEDIELNDNSLNDHSLKNISDEFWRQLDELAFQHADFLEREERLLYGADAFTAKRSRPAEVRAASPLRSLCDDRAGGELSGAQQNVSSFFSMAGESAAGWTPRVSLAVAALPGVGRSLDVRAGLHLHSIRNGCLARPAHPLLADHRVPIRSAPSSPAILLSFVSFSSYYSARPSRAWHPLAPDDNPGTLSSCDPVTMRCFRPALRYELIGVSL